MRFHLKCLECGATTWCNGSHDYDTNTIDLSDHYEAEWDEPENHLAAMCQHEGYDIIDQEYDQDLTDYI